MTNLHRRAIIAATLIVLFLIIWIFSQNGDMGRSKEIQKQENPTAPQIDSPAPESINPEDFAKVILDSRFEYYVKAGGEITYLSDMNSEITIVVLPGTLHYDAETLPNDPQNTMTFGNYGDYSHAFKAPLVPGVYNGVVVTRTNDREGKIPENKNFKLTVVDEIKTEAEAYVVAEHFLRTKAMTVEDVQLKGWTEQKKEITPVDQGWNVSLEFGYQSCGVDWEDSVCAPQQTKAHVLVHKNGIVEEIP